MRLTHHVLLSALVAACVWAVLRSFTALVGVFCGGVLIDMDHWFDYVREYGRPRSLAHFFDVCYSACGFKRLVLPLHAWEWVILLAGLAAHYGFPPWLVGLTLGWTTRLVADQLVNRPGSRWGYSLVYRAVKRFDGAVVLPRPGKQAGQDTFSA